MAPRRRRAASRGTLRFSPDDARAILAYDRAVYDRYLRRVARMPWREAKRDRGTGHGSYFDTLLHIVHPAEAWLLILPDGDVGPTLEQRLDDPTRWPTDLPGLRRYAARVWSDIDRWAADLTDRSLSRPVSAPWMAGRFTIRDAILQATLEQAHHLGELIGAMWQTDTEPPEMTWMDTRRALVARRGR